MAFLDSILNGILIAYYTKGDCSTIFPEGSSRVAHFFPTSSASVDFLPSIPRSPRPGDLLLLTMAPTVPHNADGQDHERLHMQQQAEGPETLPYTPPVMAEANSGKGAGVVDPPDITVLQRMLSATAGSLLTGLLG